MKAALRLIADHLHIATGYDSADKIWRSLEHHLDSRVSENRSQLDGEAPFLLFDEAQNLDLSILKEIVDFPSRFKVPVVVCGNPDLLKRTRVRSGAYEQIASRVAKRAVLTSPCEKDFQSIAVDFDVCGLDAHKACVALGQNTSIRELVQMLETARAYAGDGPLRLDEVKRAVLWIRGGDRALRLLSPAA